MSPRNLSLVAILLILGIIDIGLYSSQALFFSNVTANNGHIADTSSTIGTEPVSPLPLSIPTDARKVVLGKRIFHDPRLSRDNSISCASCHNLSTAGVDSRKVSVGVGGKIGELNAPTVFNSGFNLYQFWDGRAESLEAQVSGPLTAHGEMDSNWPEVIAKLKKDAYYPKAFAFIYPDGMTGDNIADTIAEFERSLVTPNSRFDRFLRGDDKAISPEEKHGYQLFKTYGCASCHQGAALGGNMFERLGSVHDYFADHGPERPVDLGRYNITHQEYERHYFKVASLRNVAKTAPYFHNGSASTLEEAIYIMAYYNLGLIMPQNDINSIASFLRTLTGEYEGRPL